MRAPSPEPRPLVLIATLNAPVRVELARLVARRGMAALACFDGAAAVTAGYIQRGTLRAAILDSDLPTIPGDEVARALSADLPGLAALVLCRRDAPPPSGPQDRSGLAPDELARIEAWLGALPPVRDTAAPAVALALG